MRKLLEFEVMVRSGQVTAAKNQVLKDIRELQSAAAAAGKANAAGTTTRTAAQAVGGQAASKQQQTLARVEHARISGAIGAKQAQDYTRFVNEQYDVFRQGVEGLKTPNIDKLTRKVNEIVGKLNEADQAANTVVEERRSRKDERAAKAAAKSSSGVGSGAGDLRVPDQDEIDEIKKLVAGHGKTTASMQNLLARAKDFAGVNRDLGLQVGQARERGMAEYDIEAKKVGAPTLTDRRTDLSMSERKREAEEQEAFARRLIEEKGLADATAIIKGLRQKQAAIEADLLNKFGDVGAVADTGLSTAEFNRRVSEKQLGITPDPSALAYERDAVIALKKRTESLKGAALAADGQSAADKEATAHAKSVLDQERGAGKIRENELADPKADAAVKVSGNERKRRAAEAELGLSAEGLSISQRNAAITYHRAAEKVQAGIDRQNGLNQAQREAESALRRQARGSSHGNKTFDVEQAAAAEGRRAGPYQRLQAFTQHRVPGEREKSPFEFPTALQGVGSAATTTARFAVSGAVFYGIARAVSTTVKEIDALDLSLAGVRDHMNAIGRGGDFAGVRRDIIGMSGDLGIAANEVADVAGQMIGAFRSNGGVARAIAETRASLKVSLVTGIPQNELTDSLTGVAITYGKTIEEIGNLSLGLESRFGVLARETLKVFGDLGPTAHEAGLSLEELGSLAAAVQQRSARTGSAIAEGFGRVLPAIQGSALGIVQLYQSIPKLAPKGDSVADLLGAGKTGDVLLGLVKDYDSLSESQKKYLTTLLGGRKEAQLLNPMFAARGQIIEELRTKQDDSNRVNERYNEISQTLTRTLAELQQKLIGIGQKLANLGALDVFKLLAGSALLAVTTVSKLLDVASSFNDILKGWPGRILAVATALKALSFAQGLLAGAGAAKAAVIAGGAAGGGGGGGMLGVLGAFLGAGNGGAAGAAAAAGRTGRISGLLGKIPFLGGALSGAGALGAMTVPGTGALSLGGLGAAGGAAAGAATLGLGAAGLYIWKKDAEQLAKLRKQRDKAEAIREKGFGNLTLRALGARSIGGNGMPGGNSGQRSGFWDTLVNPTQWKNNPIIAGLSRQDPNNEKLGQFLSGGTTDDEALDKLTKKRGQQAFLEAAGRNMFKGQLSREQIDALKLRLEQGKDTKKAYAEIAKLSEEQQDELEGALRGADQLASDTESHGARQQLLLADLPAAYAAGEITYRQMVRQTRSAVNTLGKIAQHGEGAAEDVKNWNDAKRGEVAEANKLVQTETQMALLLSQAQGGNAAEAYEIMRRTLFAKGGVKGGPAQMEEAQKIIAAQKTAWEESIRNASSIEEARRLLENGPPINRAALDALDPEGVSGGIVRGAAGKGAKPAFGDAFRPLASPTAAQVDPFADSVSGQLTADKAAQDAFADKEAGILNARAQLAAGSRLSAKAQANLALTQATTNLHVANGKKDEKGILDATIARDQALEAVAQASRDVTAAMLSAQSSASRNPAVKAAKDLQLANNAYKQATANGDEAGQWAAWAQQQSALQASQDDASARANAQAELAKAMAPKNRMRGAQIDLNSANRTLAEANSQDRGDAAIAEARAGVQEAKNALNDLASEFANSAAQLAKAMSPKDRMRGAQIDLDSANRVLAEALQGGDAGAIDDARAGVQTVKNAMADLVSEFANSAAQMAITIAEANGEVVKAAQLRLADAQRRLKEAQGNDSDQGVVDQLTGEVAAASSAATTAARNDRIVDLEWLYEQRKITASALVAALRLELEQVVPTDKAARMDIERKIKQLTDDMGNDFSLNLPATFKLPTLYEGRRLGQTGGDYLGGTANNQTINDNRYITITIPDAGDPMLTAQAVAAMLSEAPRQGITAKAY